MKKNILTYVFFIGSAMSFGQLTVKSNSSIFVKNTVLYVKGEIDLQTTNNIIYLRNESQLVQGTIGASANKGLGSLSVFQEGTSNAYRYNYWCSPVGTPSATVGNSMFGITLLNRPTSSTVSAPANMLSSSYNGQASNLSISTYWIYRYLAGATYSQWTATGQSGVIEAGEGFTMKGTSGSDPLTVGELTANRDPDPVAPIPPSFVPSQRYDFRGKPNDGDIIIKLAPNSSTLTGNPYPSALDVNAFLLDPLNVNITRVAYYWDQDRNPNSHNLVNYVGGYGVYAPVALNTDGIYTPATYKTYNLDGSENAPTGELGQMYERRYAPIGQGFMVAGNGTLVMPNTVIIKNNHRVWYKESLLNSDFSKIANTSSKNVSTIPNIYGLIRIKTNINDLYSRELALALYNLSTDGVDAGMDAKSPNIGNTLTDSYFFLDDTEYVIQSIPFDVTKRIKLGVKVTDNNTNFSFAVKEVQDFDDSQPIFIFDSLDNSYHNIKQNPYNVVLPAGTSNNRFEITFRDENALAIENLDKINFAVLQNNSEANLSISNPNLSNLTSVQIFDMSGKAIIQKKNLGSNANYSLSTSALSDGVYIVNLKAENDQSFTQKIIVSKSK
jgi:hypothetical protein